MLSYIRGQIRDLTSTITEIHGYQAGKGYHSLDVKFKDFALKIEVKFKDQSLLDSLKKKLKVSIALDKFETDIVAPHDVKTILKRQSDYFKQLSEKVDFEHLTHVFQNILVWFRKND